MLALFIYFLKKKKGGKSDVNLKKWPIKTMRYHRLSIYRNDKYDLSNGTSFFLSFYFFFFVKNNNIYSHILE